MKKNMLRVMDELKIDSGIRGLIRQLWKHCYVTTDCCEGHGQEGYVLYKGNSGDGWFEKEAASLGFYEFPESDCCDKIAEKFPQYKVCKCGRGINGYKFYLKE
ncbi:MAG: hypothetical protein KKA62_01690 [Nanoarchaeota archaeon]|nr:hypothetical protein [Nanoarchaeota archaeon]MBU1643758.1 hypothetical protein [Nanoarchaeota archaeon]MBU1976645.1 hypothetical protein [Nanoarchaeota archaeon]